MIRKILLCSLLIFCIPKLYAEPLNVAFFTPSPPEDEFWAQVTQIAQASADDLNIQLRIYYNAYNRILLNEQIQELIKSKDKPDYLVFMPFGGNIELIFNQLEEAKIPFITLERTYEQHQNNQDIDKPLGKFPLWIGEVFFDNVAAGTLLTQSLYHQAKKRLDKKSLSYQTIALGGDYHAGTERRHQGLLNSAKTLPIQLNQLVHTNWSAEVGKDKLIKLLERYGQQEIIWCASDKLALAALSVLNKKNLSINKEVFIGGFDWTPTALKKIKENKLTASVGGHIFQGARALIKLFDYHNGIDTFNRDEHYQGYPLELIDIDNITQYQLLTHKNDWQKVDFNFFSTTKTRHPLPFTSLNILKSLKHF